MTFILRALTKANRKVRLIITTLDSRLKTQEQEVEDPKVLVVANEISNRYGLRASFLEGARSVGVQGDTGSYTRVILLEGQFPGHEAFGGDFHGDL